MNVSEVERNEFLLNLFRTYDELELMQCMANFTKIYNQVFTQEKPAVVNRYFISEVRVVELLDIENNQTKVRTPFKVKFTLGTTRNINFANSKNFENFLARAVKHVKTIDKKLEDEELFKRKR